MTVEVRLNHEPRERSIYEKLIPDQKYALVGSFILESGKELRAVPVAYSSWGSLNDDANNAIIICHALSGSSNVQDWWGPMIGPGKAFDPSRFFLFCGNMLGSPYGSASPLTRNISTGRAYGPNFPLTTIRDDVRLHKLVLDALGVKSVAAVVGGSLGGMATLEWPRCTPPTYVKNIIPIATSTEHGAWGIAWGEAQRQCIYADGRFNDGHYLPTPEGQPIAGLAAARVVGMLTYRSNISFESRFGRKLGDRRQTSGTSSKSMCTRPKPRAIQALDCDGEQDHVNGQGSILPSERFTAQDYLDYQGQKFIRRFDANCYISLTQKMDTHDIYRSHFSETTTTKGDEYVHRNGNPTDFDDIKAVKALVIGVESDVLFSREQQLRVADQYPGTKCVMLQSPDGHDGFLLEFERLNDLILEHLQRECPEIYATKPRLSGKTAAVQPTVSGDSIFGEMESGWD